MRRGHWPFWHLEESAKRPEAGVLRCPLRSRCCPRSQRVCLTRQQDTPIRYCVTEQEASFVNAAVAFEDLPGAILKRQALSRFHPIWLAFKAHDQAESASSHFFIKRAK
jgi:hypothetical protein